MGQDLSTRTPSKTTVFDQKRSATKKEMRKRRQASKAWYVIRTTRATGSELTTARPMSWIPMSWIIKIHGANQPKKKKTRTLIQDSRISAHSRIRRALPISTVLQIRQILRILLLKRQTSVLLHVHLPLLKKCKKMKKQKKILKRIKT